MGPSFCFAACYQHGGVRALVQGSTSRKNRAIFSAKISLVISDAKNGIIWEQQS